MDNNNLAAQIPAPLRRRFRLFAFMSTWFGCFAEVMLESTAIVILYLSALGASNGLIMLSTSMAGLVQMFLLIPSSSLVDRFGPKKMVNVSCCIATGAYLLMALAPLFGKTIDQYVVLAGCFIYCLSKPIWTSSWYPILGNILLPSERADFFGLMRFSYYILTGGVFFLVGLFMGKEPPVWLLQLTIAVTGLLVLGRMVCISQIQTQEHHTKNLELRKAFGISIRNAPLVGFSVYVAFLSLAFAAIVPVTLLYLKDGLHYEARTIQTLSSIGIGGSVFGFLLYGKIVKRTGPLPLQLWVHGSYIAIPLILFFCKPSAPLVGACLFAANFSLACFGCLLSSELMALARPGNLAMATSLTHTYQYVGVASGRLIVSFLLGHGLLATSWRFWSMPVSYFQTIFLLCASIAIFSLTLLFCLPSLVPKHEDYYAPWK